MTDVVVELVSAPTVEVESTETDIDVQVTSTPTVEAPIAQAVAVEVEIPGQKGDPGESGGATTLATAGTNLSGHRCVTLEDGEANYADPATVGQAQILLTLGAALDGDTVELLAFGEHTESSWAWNDGPVYLTAIGVLSQTPPTSGFLVVVAEATGTDRLFFNPRPPIALA